MWKNNEHVLKNFIKKFEKFHTAEDEYAGSVKKIRKLKEHFICLEKKH